MYLLDLDVLSAVRFPKDHPELMTWFEGVKSAELHTSVLVMQALFAGVERHGRDNLADALKLRRWFQELASGFENRIHDVDLETALLAGKLASKDTGRSSLFMMTDYQLLATALRFQLILVSGRRIWSGVEDVRIISPFQE